MLQFGTKLREYLITQVSILHSLMPTLDTCMTWPENHTVGTSSGPSWAIEQNGENSELKSWSYLASNWEMEEFQELNLE